MALLNPVITLVWAAVVAFLVMLSLGALHHSGLEWVPAMGYGQTYLSIIVLDLVLNFGHMVERMDNIAILSAAQQKAKKG